VPVDNGDNFVCFMTQSEKARTNRPIPTMDSDNTITFFGEHGGNKKGKNLWKHLFFWG
jgi:hypothetical protein